MESDQGGGGGIGGGQDVGAESQRASRVGLESLTRAGRRRGGGDSKETR